RRFSRLAGRMIFPFRDNIPLRRAPLLTYALIFVNAVMFLSFGWRTPEQQQVFILEHGFIPARISQLATHKPLVVPFEYVDRPPRLPEPAKVHATYRFDPAPVQIIATIFTCLFLHGSWMHLLTNMWFMYIFGDNVEDRL